MVRQRSLRFRLFALGDFHAIPETDGRDAEEFPVFFDASLDLRFQFVRCGDSARFQRAGKGAGQSTSEAGDDVINGCWERR